LYLAAAALTPRVQLKRTGVPARIALQQQQDAHEFLLMLMAALDDEVAAAGTVRDEPRRTPHAL